MQRRTNDWRLWSKPLCTQRNRVETLLKKRAEVTKRIQEEALGGETSTGEEQRQQQLHEQAQAHAARMARIAQDRAAQAEKTRLDVERHAQWNQGWPLSARLSGCKTRKSGAGCKEATRGRSAIGPDREQHARQKRLLCRSDSVRRRKRTTSNSSKPSCG